MQRPGDSPASWEGRSDMGLLQGLAQAMPDSGYVLDPAITYEEAYLAPQHFSPALDGAALLREGIPLFRAFGPEALEAAAAGGFSVEREMWHVLADAMGVLEGQRKILLMYHGVVGWSVELLNDYTERWLPQHSGQRSLQRGFSASFPAFLRDKYGQGLSQDVCYALYASIAVVGALLSVRAHTPLLSHSHCVTPDDTAYDLSAMERVLCLSLDWGQLVSGVFSDFAPPAPGGRKGGRKPASGGAARPLQFFIDLLSDEGTPAYCAAACALFLALQIIGPGLTEAGAAAAGVQNPRSSADGAAVLDACPRSPIASRELVDRICAVLRPERLVGLPLLEMREMEERGVEWPGAGAGGAAVGAGGDGADKGAASDPERSDGGSSKHPLPRTPSDEARRQAALAVISDGALFSGQEKALGDPLSAPPWLESFEEDYGVSVHPPEALFNRLYAAQFATLGAPQVPVVYVGNPYKFMRCAQALCGLGNALDGAFSRPERLVRVPLLRLLDHASRSSYMLPEKLVLGYFFAAVPIPRAALMFGAGPGPGRPDPQPADEAWGAMLEARLFNRLTAAHTLSFALRLAADGDTSALRRLSGELAHALATQGKMEGLASGYAGMTAVAALQNLRLRCLVSNRQRQARILRKAFLVGGHRWAKTVWDVRAKLLAAQKPGTPAPVRPVFMHGLLLTVSFWVAEFFLLPALRLVGQTSVLTTNGGLLRGTRAVRGGDRMCPRVVSPDWLFHSYVCAGIAEASAEIYALLSEQVDWLSGAATEPGAPGQRAQQSAELAYLRLRAGAWRRACLSQLCAVLFLLRGSGEGEKGRVEELSGGKAVDSVEPDDSPGIVETAGLAADGADDAGVLLTSLTAVLRTHRLNKLAMYKLVHLADLCVFDYCPGEQRTSHFIDRLIQRIEADALELLRAPAPPRDARRLQIGFDEPCGARSPLLTEEEAVILAHEVMEHSRRLGNDAGSEGRQGVQPQAQQPPQAAHATPAAKDSQGARPQPESAGQSNLFIPPFGTHSHFSLEVSLYVEACTHAWLVNTEPPPAVVQAGGMEYYACLPAAKDRALGTPEAAAGE